MNEGGALRDLVVLDLSRVLAGPYCTMMLADFGAQVIKIEIPGVGDDTRAYPPFHTNRDGAQESLYFANINRNKKGITLNLKQPEGKKLFRDLVKKADIVVENYRPGVMDRLGLGYEELKKINPRIIYGSVSGFGDTGPYRLRPGYDILAQAMGGLMAITGAAGGPPTRVGSAMGDILGGLHLVIGLFGALHARQLTGRGQRVDISLMDCVIAATENTAIKYLESGQIPPRMGNRYAAVSPYDAFRVKDGKIIIAAGNQRLYEKLCTDILHRPDMIEDPRFTTMEGRLKDQDAIAAVIEETLSDMTMEEAVELVLSKGIPAGPIYDISQILQDPQVQAREMFVPMEHPTLGPITVNGCAVKLGDTAASVRTPAPALGQDNLQIYQELLELTEEEVAALRDQDVI